MPSWMGLGFQDSSCYLMSELIFLHDHILMIMILVLFVVVYFFSLIFVNYFYYKFLSEATVIEVVWSILPAFLLSFLLVPSIKVLYLMEDIKQPLFSFKVVGHQWYWSYIVPFFKNLTFFVGGESFFSYEYDSMMEGDYPRLLDSSSELFLPVNCISRLLITSSDVIHCFALPSLGLKVDALPGRINQLFVNPFRVGVFYGECSEICGSNHSFMPIFVKVVDLDLFDLVSKDYMLEIISDLGLNFDF